MRPSALLHGVLVLVAALQFALPAGAGFHRADVGDVVVNAALPALDGGRQPLLGDAAVNVFVFFKPGQEHSRSALVQLAECEKVFAGKSVRWAVIASDRFKPSEIKAEIKAAGLSMPVLIDIGDELYGRLGVVLSPNIGITDREHRLVADLPFAKVNYAAVIRGHIRRQLQEIGDAELQNILNPPAAGQGGEAEVMRRRLKYAQKLFQTGRLAKALENVRRCLGKEPEPAAAHVLLGQILSAQGRREEALNAFDKALQLDPANAAARSGKKAL